MVPSHRVGFENEPEIHSKGPDKDFDFKIALSDISPLVMQYSTCNTQANLIDDADSESDAQISR